MQQGNIPIVFIHRGDSAYLPVTLLQLAHTNPNTSIYLIGDDSNRHYQSLVKHVSITDFFQQADLFKTIYKHFSTNGYEFELICIQRWFVLLEFMDRYALESCIYLDSDILVYSDLNHVQPSIAQYGMTVAGISGHSNFVNNKHTLKLFCEFIWNAYSSANAEATLKNRYQLFLKDHPLGGISDMSFFTMFREQNPGVVGDLSQPVNDTVFDITLDTISDYESESKTGFKKIAWMYNQPFGKLALQNKLIQFHTLHFQGRCKGVIYSYSTLTLFSKLRIGIWLAHYYFKKLKKKLLG